MSQTFSIITLGCKVNKVEADSMSVRLTALGATQSALEAARVVLINTCTVTGEADSKTRKAAHRALRDATPGATVIVCGCGATAHPEQFKDEPTELEVIANKADALQRAIELLELDISTNLTTSARVGEGFNTRVAIKVQDGCDNACSYCIVPKARGAACSVPLGEVLDEVAANTQAGAKEIILTGIDLGCYHEGAVSLTELLERILAVGEDFRIRLSSIELPSISDKLLNLIAASEGHICAHLHIPLQSGSERILEAMRRNYTAWGFLQRLAEIKTVVPHIALSTDVIVGFPGETEDDFNDTLAFCEQAGFSRIHIFRYSKRPGTVAATMPQMVSSEIKAQRAEELRRLALTLTEQDATRRIGSCEAVLRETAQRGRTESYYPVKLSDNAPGDNLVTMELTAFSEGAFSAKMC